MFKSNAMDGKEGFSYFAFGMVRCLDLVRVPSVLPKVR
jgi:hypothetical protein